MGFIAGPAGGEGSAWPSAASDGASSEEQLCYLGRFALKLGDNGYHKLGELVAKETILTKLGTTVTKLPGWLLRHHCCRERLNPMMLDDEPVYVRR